MRCTLFWSFILTVFYLFGLSTLPLIAQKTVLPFHQLAVADNLSAQSFNYYILKDSDGYVWISSINGLNRYDGQEVIQFQPEQGNDASLIEGSIQGELYEDKKTNIWFGTNKGVQCYHKNTRVFKNYDLGININLSEPYKVLYMDKKREHLWVGIGYDLYRLNVGDPLDYQLIMNYKTFDQTCFVERDSFLLIYSPLEKFKGLGKVKLKFRNDSLIELPLIDTLLLGESVFDLHYENEDTIWVISQKGLHLIDGTGKERTFVDQFNGIELTSMVSVNPFGNESLLVATRSAEEGMYLFDKSDLEFSTQIYLTQNHKVQPFNMSVEKVNITSDSAIWISTRGRGVFYTKPSHKKMEAYLQNYKGAFSSKTNILGIAEDQSGNLWCLTVEGIVVMTPKGHINPQFKKWIENPPSFLKEDTYSIFIDNDNRVWVASYSGLFVLDDLKEGTFRAMKKNDGDSFIRIPWKCMLNNGHRLFSTFDIPDSLSNGLYKIVENGQSFSCKNVTMSEMYEGFNYIFEDQGGAIYLSEFSKNVVKGRLVEDHFEIDHVFPLKGMVTGMAEDMESGTIWIACSSGLYQIESEGDSCTLKENRDFEVKNLKGILYDTATKTLWISSTTGLFAFNPQAETYRSFSSFEGLQSPEFNFHSAFKTSSGMLAFGGVNGLNLFDPSKVLASPSTLPTPKITQVNVNDVSDKSLQCAISETKNVSQFKKLKLPFEKRTLSFSFSAMDYSDPASNQFRYMMEGIDNNWVNLESGNLARYANLPIGEHTFHVISSSTDGIWPDSAGIWTDNKVASLKIEIEPPWYRSWLAYFIYGILSLGIIYGLYRFRINQVKKEAAFKQKEAELKQLAAETETAVLRLQMNPHFIFNSMNSISSYISERDIGTANTYLNRFAKLMRLILKLGKQPLIPIADEIDLLEQYLKTEAMRFERKFSYDFNVAQGVDEDEHLVPTMILQPFIENAIWHGLSGLNRKGHIQIRFWLEAKSLYISITDNGVGREAAKMRKGLGTHESQALNITRRRLQLLSEKENQPSDFYFEDVLNEAGQVAGTKVVLQLPVI